MALVIVAGDTDHPALADAPVVELDVRRGLHVVDLDLRDLHLPSGSGSP